MRLREYQLEATRACIEDLKQGYNPCITMATGTGKSVVICDLATKLVSTYKKRVWVLTHNMKLTEQNHATWEKHFKFACRSGLVCSGLRPVGRWDFEEAVIFGTIQTVENYAYRKTVFQYDIPPPDVLIIDEAHRVPMTPSGKSQYEKIFKLYPEAQRVAFTATPWRMDNGPICKEKIDGSSDDTSDDGNNCRSWFDRDSFQYDVKRGVSEGYLAPLVGLNSKLQLNLDEVTITSKGDYNKTELDRIMHRAEYDAWLVAVARSLNQFEDRQFIAVYCTSVKIATRFAHLLWEHTNRKSCQVYGHHKKDQRDKIFERVRTGKSNALVSVDMLTTGFDLPRLDTIVCLRPTLSSSLWVQIMGRGTRLAEGKTDCLVLDYVGNFMRLGGVQMMPDYKDEKSGTTVQAQTPVRPHVKKERRVFPGVKTLEIIDPLTGELATDESIIKAKVHDCSGWVNGNVLYITVKYVCETENGVRIDATQFIDTSNARQNNRAHEFFRRRRMIVRLPLSNPRTASYQIKNARRPNFVLLKRSPRNKAWWNVIKEIWTDE
tara:strand:- start:1900 stop:3540 length:1641 start_codon:yes stop_codon:yes gene_type:complete